MHRTWSCFCEIRCHMFSIPAKGSVVKAYPEARLARSWNTRRTVWRLTPCVCASSASVGIRSPSAKRPSSSAERRATYSLQKGKRIPLRRGQKATRVPPGHPEAFIEAFANVYAGVTEAVLARKKDASPTASYLSPPSTTGRGGVYFFEKVVESAGSQRKWTEARWRVPRLGRASSTPTSTPTR